MGLRLWLNGRDLRDRPLAQRKKRLEGLIAAAAGPICRAPCIEEEGRELFEAACLDLEGIVAKRKADPYEVRTAWYKVKNPTRGSAEGVIRPRETTMKRKGEHRGLNWNEPSTWFPVSLKALGQARKRLGHVRLTEWEAIDALEKELPDLFTHIVAYHGCRPPHLGSYYS